MDFTRGQRIYVLFPKADDPNLRYEGKVVGCPGDTVRVYDNDEVVQDGHYRVWYTARGYGYNVTLPADRIQAYPV